MTVCFCLSEGEQPMSRRIGSLIAFMATFSATAEALVTA
jgi:hypothetical protein